jgi:hypothetical protein
MAYQQKKVSSYNFLTTFSTIFLGLINYSIVTPAICLFGIVGNTLSLVVLSRRELKGSVYVYLAVLAFVDLCSSILLFMSGLSCGVLFLDSKWPIYDVLLGLPLAAMFNAMSVFTTIMVTFDRICYLAKPLRRRKPKFCHAYVARRIMVFCLILSILISLPYCFIFTTDGKNELKPRQFYFASSYNWYNWIRFILLGVLPSVFLIFGNGYLIYALRKIKKLYGQCKSFKCKKQQNYTNHLTTTLILIVFFFLINQIPSLLTNRASASTFIFFASSSNDSCNSKSLETVRQISTIVNAVSLSTDFVLYYMFCPAFCKVLGKLFRRKARKKPVQMNVFVLDKQICFDNNGKSINELTTGKLFQMMNDESNRDSLPSSIYSCDRSEEERVKNNRDTLITLCPDAID